MEAGEKRTQKLSLDCIGFSLNVCSLQQCRVTEVHFSLLFFPVPPCPARARLPAVAVAVAFPPRHVLRLFAAKISQ